MKNQQGRAGDFPPESKGSRISKTYLYYDEVSITESEYHQLLKTKSSR
ncbi:hypothetical protein [Acetobacterium woodii]|nr:hypothetical protein [Acetobacterium woodii]